MRHEINVTDLHIRQAVVGSCSRCPVALALKEALPEATVADVLPYREGNKDFYIAVIYTGGVWDEYRLPKDVCSRISDYDRTYGMEPFSFEMEMER